MRETENIFDTSTTLMDIDEPAGGDVDARPRGGPPPDAGGEPDYFTPNPAVGHTDARRRALAVLGVVGGGILMAVLISAATGLGGSRPAVTAKSPTPGEQPAGEGSATVVSPKRAPRAARRRAPAAGGTRRRLHAGGAGKAVASAHRRHRDRHHSRAPQRSAPSPPPPPEPTYTAEPEATYVPTEEAAPPPAAPPSSSSSSSGGAQQEFGFEP